MQARHAKRALGILAAIVAAQFGRGARGEAAYVRQTETEAAIGNRFLELGLRRDKGRWSATRLVNKLAGTTTPIQVDWFALGFRDPSTAPPGVPLVRRTELVPHDFAFKRMRHAAMPAGQRLIIEMEGASHGVRLDIIYELGDHDFFIRRTLEVVASKPLELRHVTVWHARLPGTCTHQGFGEPVFLDDTFWGLEHPGGHNEYYAKVAVRLTHFPGRTITGRFVSKTAVLGVAEPGRVGQRFRQYVETFQATPKDRNLFVNYNTWWTLMPPTEENCLALIDLFKRKLFDPFGVSFDTFTIDDGWDNKKSLWATRADRFPRGFAPLAEALRPMNANLGLWLSPSSGYGHAPWGGAHGYERNSNPWYLCQSGPRYRRDIVEVVTRLAREHRLAFFKFDGFCPSCEAEGHGHLPGNYAREANIDAYIELLTAVRQARPGIYLDPTCGMWLSPWWLRYVDSIWGSVSGDYPSIVVPAPIVRDSATTTRDAVFRQRCRQHPGFPPAAIEHLGIIVITPEKWEDNAMAVVGRGSRLLTLYINPKHFRHGERDWAFLASLLKWVRHNAATLSHTRLIGGDPFKREVYGYAHFRGQRGVIALRNPFIEPQAIKLQLDESVGWTRPLAQDDWNWFARVVYPCQRAIGPLLRGGTLQLTLQGYETVLVHVEGLWRQPVLLAARAREIAREGKRLTYAVYGRPGQKLNTRLAWRAHVENAWQDGQQITLARRHPRGPVPVEFSGRGQACRVEAARLEPRAADGSWQLVGRCVAHVPQDATATMHVLCDPSSGFPGKLVCTADVDGKAAQVRAVRRPTQRRQAHSAHSWTWFEFPVPGGRSDVAVTVKPSAPNLFFRGEAGWWLWIERRLKKATLTLEVAEPLPPTPNEPFPMPIRMETEREIITIQAPKAFRTPKRWPKLDKASVYLDEVAPDEVKQDWGTLQRNQSVWEKPMIIAGRKFARGLGTHANSRILYDLSGGKFRSFRCLVGRDEHANDGRIVFQVWVDKKKAFDSGPMTKASAPKSVQVDVKGAAVLELRTLDGGDSINGDHGNWADAQLVR